MDLQLKKPDVIVIYGTRNDAQGSNLRCSAIELSIM